MDEDNFLNELSEDVILGGNDMQNEHFTCESPSAEVSDTENTTDRPCSSDYVYAVASAAAEKIGNVPEIWMNILSQADQITLQSAIRVNKAWCSEGLPYLWQSPNEAGLRFDGTSRRQPERITFYARLVRHIQYSVWTDRGNHCRVYTGSRKKQMMPKLPNLISLDCMTSSLSERTAAQLRSIFVPSLKQVNIGDHVAYDSYMERPEELGGVSWFDIMCMECPLLETLSLGECSGISREDFHHFLARTTKLRTIKLDRGNEQLLIDPVRPFLKSLKVCPEWMMGHDSYEMLSQLHALEYLDIAVVDTIITSEKLLGFRQLEQLTHLHIWPTDNTGTTQCTVTARELIVLIQALPELSDLRIWLDFDFFRFEEAIENAYHLPGRYPQFDDANDRCSYLDYLQKTAEAESKAPLEILE